MTWTSSVWTLILLAISCGYECRAADFCNQKFAVHLEREPLRTALNKLIMQLKVNNEPNLLFTYGEIAADIIAPAVNEQLTADEALTQLLAGSGFHHEFVNASTITVSPVTAQRLPNAFACPDRSNPTPQPPPTAPSHTPPIDDKRL